MANALILTEGGGKTGMGHISRCLSFYWAFAKFQYTPMMVINGDATSNMLIGINHSTFDWIENEKRLLSIAGRSDVIVVDSYFCPLVFYEKLSKACPVVIYIDDNNRLTYPPGFVVNGVMGAEKMDYPPKEGITYLLGYQYAFLRKAFWDIPDRSIQNELSSVMISCGGNDENDLSFRILKLLVENYSDLKKSIVLNKSGTPHIDYFKQHSQVLTNLDEDQMKTLMFTSDIAITAAGQTSYELCRIGTPFVALITAENQKYSIENFDQHQLLPGPAIDVNDERMEQKILEQIAQLVDQETRKKISENMRHLVSGKGTLKVVEQVLKTIYTTQTISKTKI